MPTVLRFRSGKLKEGTVFEPRQQPWCKVGFVLSGVMDISIEGQRFLSPPHFGTWMPASALHSGQNRESVEFVSIDIHPSLCDGFPDSPCTLSLSNLVRAITQDFQERDVAVPASGEDLRLAHVLIDQLRKAPRRASYLPLTDDPLIEPLIEALRKHPSDKRSLADWAELAGKTERTLSRRFQSALGIPFNEWRQRLKLVEALSLIEKGESVQAISRQLGYSTPSAFIAMFRRLTGMSPRQMQS